MYASLRAAMPGPRIALRTLPAAIALALVAPQSAAQAVGTEQAPTEMAPTVVTANPLGSGLFELVPPVSVISGKELDVRRESTLGETLNGVPGVSSSYFGPNASRPVIRGLDADRVRIMQNGIGLTDVSALSPDHAVALDPLVVNRIEVVRGPAALLYGGSAVGGVVNAIDNRIPQEPVEGINGRVEARFGGPDDERSGAALLEAGNGILALHADIYSRRNDDIEIPGFARSARQRALDPAGMEQPRGKLPNSSADGDGGALGASLIFDRGYAGIAYSDFNANYGTVAEESVRIDMQNTRWDFAGELRDLGPLIEKVKVRFGHSDYEHREIEDGEVATTFLSDSREARIEATHRPLGPFTGAIGLQLGNLHFSALGEESFVPKTRTDSRAAYLYEELPLDRLKLTFGGRLERAEVESAGGGPDDPNNPGTPRFGAAQTRDFSPRSYAMGALYTLTKELALAANLSHTERAPTYNELFANGPHNATGQYEVGDPNLDKEKSNGADLQLRWRSGAHSASIGGYYTRFSNYIGLFNTGATRGADGERNPVDAGVADASGEPILPEAALQAVPAAFYGFEAEGKFRVYEQQSTLDLNLRSDYVRAKNRDTGEPLPRISPLRVSAGLDYRLANLGARLDVMHAAKQDRTAENELPTGSYTLVNALLTYRIRSQTPGLEAFVKVNNLFDEEARLHTSTLKDIAPLPGRGVLLGVRGTF